MYLYHVLFTLINICGIDCKKKNLKLLNTNSVAEQNRLYTRSEIILPMPPPESGGGH
jgi:hypothetical protein